MVESVVVGIEQRFEITNARVVNPDRFLKRPAYSGRGELDIGRLPAVPNINLLRQLPWITDPESDLCEVGIVRRKGTWFIFKTDAFSNRVEFTPKDSEIWIHSHQAWEDASPDSIGTSLPSTSDFIYCLEGARNFVVSQDGMVEYWPIVINGVRMQRKGIHEIITEMEIGDTNSEYMRLLNGVQARIKLYAWEELTPEILADLFS